MLDMRNNGAAQRQTGQLFTVLGPESKAQSPMSKVQCPKSKIQA